MTENVRTVNAIEGEEREKVVEEWRGFGALLILGMGVCNKLTLGSWQLYYEFAIQWTVTPFLGCPLSFIRRI